MLPKQRGKIGSVFCSRRLSSSFVVRCGFLGSCGASARVHSPTPGRRHVRDRHCSDAALVLSINITSLTCDTALLHTRRYNKRLRRYSIKGRIRLQIRPRPLGLTQIDSAPAPTRLRYQDQPRAHRDRPTTSVTKNDRTTHAPAPKRPTIPHPRLYFPLPIPPTRPSNPLPQ